VVQTCWDPDCRGFRSSPIIVPAAVAIEVETVRRYQRDYADKMLLLAIEKGEIP